MTWKSVSLGVLALLAVTGLWLAYVAQSGYTPRAKVMEGLNLSGGAKAAVADFYTRNGSFPANNAEAYLSESISGRFVSDVSVKTGGVIEITYGGSEPDKKIAGKKLFLEAIVSADGKNISWACRSDDIPARHTPSMCRQ